jgi:hypothetical protein
LECIAGFPAYSLLAYTYGRMGRKEEGEKMLSELKSLGSKGYVDPADMAIAEFGLGYETEAFNHFEEAYKERSAWLLYCKALPAFEPIRTDQRYKAILTRMGLDN